MRGLVTLFGGSGFIGANVVRVLAEKGWRIRVAVRRPWQAYKLRLLGDVGQIEAVQANIRAPDTVARALEGAEAAVYSVGILYESGRQSFEGLQATGPRTVAETASRLGVGRMVLVSAIGADPHAVSQYARTKAEGEAAALAAHSAVTILRPSIVFGPDDRFFNRFAGLAVRSPVLPLFGGGATRLQPVFVGDVARAVGAALAEPPGAARAYELGGPGVHSLRELMEITLREIGRPRALLSVPWGVANMLGVAGDLGAWLRGPLPMIPEPPITTDQVALLRSDNVVSPGAPGLADLGIAATPMEPILPTYLYRYRKGGQFADMGPAAFQL